MAAFVDARGDLWTIDLAALPGRVVREFRDAIGDRSKRPPNWARLGVRLVSSPRRLGRGLWALLEGQAKEAGVNEAEFAERFADAAVIESLPAVWVAACRELRAGTAARN